MLLFHAMELVAEVVKDDSKPREARAEVSQICPFHRCPIKAQAAAGVGLTGLFLDAAKGAGRSIPAAGIWAVCERHRALSMLSRLVYRPLIKL